MNLLKKDRLSKHCRGRLPLQVALLFFIAQFFSPNMAHADANWFAKLESDIFESAEKYFDQQRLRSIGKMESYLDGELSEFDFDNPEDFGGMTFGSGELVNGDIINEDGSVKMSVDEQLSAMAFDVGENFPECHIRGPKQTVITGYLGEKAYVGMRYFAVPHDALAKDTHEFLKNRGDIADRDTRRNVELTLDILRSNEGSRRVESETPGGGIKTNYFV